MKEFNEIAVKKIIFDMIRGGLLSGDEKFSHDELIEIYNDISISSHDQVKAKYNEYYNDVVSINN